VVEILDCAQSLQTKPSSISQLLQGLKAPPSYDTGNCAFYEVAHDADNMPINLGEDLVTKLTDRKLV
jgi:hypothetical protein